MIVSVLKCACDFMINYPQYVVVYMIAFVAVRSLEIHDCYREGEGVGGGGGVRDCAYGRGGAMSMGFGGSVAGCGGGGGCVCRIFSGSGGGGVESMSVAGGMGVCGGGVSLGKRRVSVTAVSVGGVTGTTVCS